jgi:hypothetical protein
MTALSLYVYELLVYLKNKNIKPHQKGTIIQHETTTTQSTTDWPYSSKNQNMQARKLFECLPYFLQNMEKISQFKSNLKFYLVRNCFYNIESFIKTDFE